MKLALVGAGNWGKNLARVFSSFEGVELTYICDTNEDVRKRMARLYPHTLVCSRLETVLAGCDAEIDGVVIAVDASNHFPVAMACIEAGKHVFVEKPLALTVVSADALDDAASKAGVKLMVGHLLRYHPAVTFMEEAVRDGVLGKLQYMYTQRVNLGVIRQNEDAWWSLAPHDISIALSLFGELPIAVSAISCCTLREDVADTVFASLLFPHDKLTHIHVSWLDPHKVRKVTLVGSEKMIVFDDMEPAEKIRLYDKGVKHKSSGDVIDALTVRSGDIYIPQIPQFEPLKCEAEHFVQCISSDENPRTDGVEGLNVVAILEAGSESMRQHGEPVEVHR